jgi:hypothetical protein
VCHSTRTLNVAELLKGTFDTLTDLQRLCCCFSVTAGKSVLQTYHRIQRFFSNRKDIFGSSKFVKQMLRVISITLRIARASKTTGSPHCGIALPVSPSGGTSLDFKPKRLATAKPWWSID